MKNNTFTVKEVPGSKRTSPRNYTHAVIGFFDFEKAIELASVVSNTDCVNFDYYKKCSDCYPGEAYKSDGCSFPVDQKMIDKGKAIVEQYKDRITYAQKMKEDRVALLLEQQKKNGGAPAVLRWSQSFQNANKSWTEFSCFKNLRVAEVVQIISSPKK